MRVRVSVRVGVRVRVRVSVKVIITLTLTLTPTLTRRDERAERLACRDAHPARAVVIEALQQRDELGRAHLVRARARARARVRVRVRARARARARVRIRTSRMCGCAAIAPAVSPASSPTGSAAAAPADLPADLPAAPARTAGGGIAGRSWGRAVASTCEKRRCSSAGIADLFGLGVGLG